MTVDVRVATGDDLDEVVAVFLACWRESYIGVLPDDAVAAMTDERATALWARVLSEATTTVLVAVRDSSVLGVVRFTADEGVVHSLYVVPAAHGLGIGTRLLDLALESLRAGGVASATLWVFAANAPSITFYRGRGWLPDGRTRTQEEFGVPELRLGRGTEGAA